MSEEVRQQMEKLKEEWGLKSYDEVIKRMIKAQTGRPESLFGIARGSKPFIRDYEEEHEFARD